MNRKQILDNIQSTLWFRPQYINRANRLALYENTINGFSKSEVCQYNQTSMWLIKDDFLSSKISPVYWVYSYRTKVGILTPYIFIEYDDARTHSQTTSKQLTLIERDLRIYDNIVTMSYENYRNAFTNIKPHLFISTEVLKKTLQTSCYGATLIMKGN